MLEFLFVLINICILYHISTIIITLLAYGVLPFRRRIKLSKDFTLYGYEINEFGNNQLYKLNHPYIAMFPVYLRTIFWKYDIDNYGPVWRWSKLHKDIEEKFKELNNRTVNDE